MNTLISLLDNSTQSSSKSSAHFDSLLNLLIGSVSKIKSRDDLDLHKVVELMDTIWELD
jgi:hypothetical protein